jgi:hypothetical protein
MAWFARLRKYEGHRRMNLNADHVRRILRAVMTTEDRELSCDECMEELARFAEMTLVGKDTEAALPLVRAHLDMCGDCREEFEALVRALEAP